MGLTVDISTAWNLIPWTWLADWASNMGDVLAAHRNIVGQSLDGVAIMRQTRVTNTTESYGPDSYGTTMSALDTEYVIKRRRSVPVILSAGLPLLNERQVGIVGSLVITRRR
jgi:hypothetical protein